ncbi:Uncharacterised protein [Chlamydia trachomatis]|nr:Uncharacterised protein [Chlamydia trachomatis]
MLDHQLDKHASHLNHLRLRKLIEPSKLNRSFHLVHLHGRGWNIECLGDECSLGGEQGFELRACGLVPASRGECERQPVLLAPGRKTSRNHRLGEGVGVDVLWKVEHPVPI